MTPYPCNSTALGRALLGRWEAVAELSALPLPWRALFGDRGNRGSVQRCEEIAFHVMFEREPRREGNLEERWNLSTIFFLAFSQMEDPSLWWCKSAGLSHVALINCIFPICIAVILKGKWASCAHFSSSCVSSIRLNVSWDFLRCRTLVAWSWMSLVILLPVSLYKIDNYFPIYVLWKCPTVPSCIAYSTSPEFHWTSPAKPGQTEK